MLAPPRHPPTDDELEALIPEARARRRRRLSKLAAVVATVAGIGLAVWAALPAGTSALHPGGGPSRGAVDRSDAALSRFRGIGNVGSAGGVTWAISGRGFWLTSNGGRTWRLSRLPQLAKGGVASGRTDPITNIAQVRFVDRRHGWVAVMGRSRIYRTTDGGRSWHVSTPPGCSRACEGGSISFLDARHGYALLYTRARDNRLFRTSDGGRTWQLVSRPPVYDHITFVDRMTGFAFGGEQRMVIGPIRAPDFGNLYRTTDGGRTWSRYVIHDSSRFVEQPFAVFGRTVVVAQNGSNPDGGIDLAPSTVYASPDAGGHWTGRAVPPAVGVPAPLDAVSPSVWVWASHTGLYVTHTGGRRWHRIVLQALRPAASITTVDFTSSRVGWAIFTGIAPHGSLFHTTDGGVHWKPAGPRAARHRRQR
ncbi:MAG TPA: hypothetical protein VJ716_09040 [Gaiellaceae bacterium]|nr:hypothetical protein [Gaiellaceae bacterium]